MKRLQFRGSALNDLRDFPTTARREAGYQLDKVQSGEAPEDWKPMTTVGQGVQEIRVRADLDLAAKRYSDLIKELER